MGQLNCTTAGSNTGLAACRENFGMDKLYIFAPIDSDGEFAARADAETLSNWLTKINAASSNDRLKPTARIFAIEVNDEEPVYDAGSDGDQDEVREGRYDRRAMFLLSMCEHKKYRTLNNGNYALFIVTANGYIKGYTDGTAFKPFSLSTLKVEKQMPNDGTVNNKTPIRTVESNPTEWNDNFWWIKPTTWNPLTDLVGLIDCDLSISSSSATSQVVEVLSDCGQVPVTGLVEADFTLVDSAGADASSDITNFADNGDGTYTFTTNALSADTYTYDLAAVGTMTTQGYESTGGADFTIV